MTVPFTLPSDLLDESRREREEAALKSLMAETDRKVRGGLTDMAEAARRSPLAQALASGGLRTPTIDDLTPDWVREAMDQERAASRPSEQFSPKTPEFSPKVPPQSAPRFSPPYTIQDGRQPSQPTLQGQPMGDVQITQGAAPTGGMQITGGANPERQSIAYREARASGLDDEGARILVAVTETEGGMSGAIGDQGQSRGGYQFHERGEMPGFRAWIAQQGIQGDPNELVHDIGLTTRYAATGYLGRAIEAGRAEGLSGSALATYVQTHGQRSVAPEKTGQNYERLFGAGAIRPQPTTPPQAEQTPLAQRQAGQPVRVVPGATKDSYWTSEGTHGGAPAADIFAPIGSPILAPVGGISQPAVYSSGGNATTIKGDDGKYYYMAHGHVPFVGGRVEAGQPIGQVGDSGNAKGTRPHLHYAIASDPSVFGAKNGSGDVSGDAYWHADEDMHRVPLNGGPPSAMPTASGGPPLPPDASDLDRARAGMDGTSAGRSGDTGGTLYRAPLDPNPEALAGQEDVYVDPDFDSGPRELIPQRPNVEMVSGGPSPADAQWHQVETARPLADYRDIDAGPREAIPYGPRPQPLDDPGGAMFSAQDAFSEAPRPTYGPEVPPLAPIEGRGIRDRRAAYERDGMPNHGQNVLDTLGEALPAAGRAAYENAFNPTPAQQAANVNKPPQVRATEIVLAATDAFGDVVGRRVSDALGASEDKNLSVAGIPFSEQDVGGFIGSAVLDPTNLVPGVPAVRQGLRAAGRGLRNAASDGARGLADNLAANVERVAAADARIAQQGSTTTAGTFGITPGSRSGNLPSELIPEAAPGGSDLRWKPAPEVPDEEIRAFRQTAFNLEKGRPAPEGATVVWKDVTTSGRRGKDSATVSLPFFHTSTGDDIPLPPPNRGLMGSPVNTAYNQAVAEMGGHKGMPSGRWTDTAGNRHKYDSPQEILFMAQYDGMKQRGEIKNWWRGDDNPRRELEAIPYVSTNRDKGGVREYRPDFIVEHNDGRIEVLEAKPAKVIATQEEYGIQGGKVTGKMGWDVTKKAAGIVPLLADQGVGYRLVMGRDSSALVPQVPRLGNPNQTAKSFSGVPGVDWRDVVELDRKLPSPEATSPGNAVADIINRTSTEAIEYANQLKRQGLDDDDRRAALFRFVRERLLPTAQMLGREEGETRPIRIAVGADAPNWMGRTGRATQADIAREWPEAADALAEAEKQGGKVRSVSFEMVQGPNDPLPRPRLFVDAEGDPQAIQRLAAQLGEQRGPQSAADYWYYDNQGPTTVRAIAFEGADGVTQHNFAQVQAALNAAGDGIPRLVPRYTQDGALATVHVVGQDASGNLIPDEDVVIHLNRMKSVLQAFGIQADIGPSARAVVSNFQAEGGYASAIERREQVLGLRAVPRPTRGNAAANNGRGASGSSAADPDRVSAASASPNGRDDLDLAAVRPGSGGAALGTTGAVPSGSGALAQVNADLGSSLGSSVFGAAAGAAANPDDPTTGAQYGAAAGLVGGPLASRLMRRGAGGAMATPGVSPGGGRVAEDARHVYSPTPTDGVKRRYHGTASPFDAADPAKFDENGLYGPGYYTTSDPRVAGSYATTRGQAANGGASFLDGRTPDPTGANVRPVDVPPDLNMLDADAPLDRDLLERMQPLIERARDINRDIGDELKDVWDRVYESAVDRGMPVTNDNLLTELMDAGQRALGFGPGGEGRGIMTAVMERLGYDGIVHKGGKRMPLFDDAGKPIDHDVSIIFPGSVNKVRNAFSGTQGGGYLPFDPAGAAAGGAAGAMGEDEDGGVDPERVIHGLVAGAVLNPRMMARWKASQAKAAAQAAAAKAAGMAPPPTAGDWIRAVGYSGMIGPSTGIVNAVGNGVELLWQLPKDFTRAAIRGNMREAWVESKGLAAGLMHAGGEMLDALAGAHPGGGVETSRLSQRVQNPIAQLAANLLESPTRLFSEVPDAFYRSISQSMGEYRQAAQIATDMGLTGQKWSGYVDTLIKEAERVRTTGSTQVSADTRKVLDAGEKLSERLTLRGDIGPRGQKFKQGMDALPGGVGHLLMPFFNTPYQMSQRMLERTPVGARMGTQPTKFDKHYDTIVGSLVAGGMVGLAAGGAVTGSGPDDPEKRKALTAQGWQANSTLVAGRWVPNNAFGVFGPLLDAAGESGDAMRYQKKDATAREKWNDVRNRAGNIATNQVYLRGIADIVKAVGSPGERGEAWAASTLGRAVPMGATLRLGATAEDPYERRPEPAKEVGSIENIRQRMARSMPNELPTPLGTRGQLPIDQDILGRPIENPRTGAAAFGPKMNTPRPDPILERFQRAGVDIGSPRGEISDDGVQIDLSPAETRRWNELRGQEIIKATQRMIDSGLLDRLPPARATERLEGAKSDAAERATAALRREVGLPEWNRRRRDARLKEKAS